MFESCDLMFWCHWTYWPILCYTNEPTCIYIFWVYLDEECSWNSWTKLSVLSQWQRPRWSGCDGPLLSQLGLGAGQLGRRPGGSSGRPGQRLPGSEGPARGPPETGNCGRSGPDRSGGVSFSSVKKTWEQTFNCRFSKCGWHWCFLYMCVWKGLFMSG